MRSDLIFGALTHVNNRYELCQLASKATRKLHKPNTRLQDTTNEVLDRFKDTVPMDDSEAVVEKVPALTYFHEIRQMSTSRAIYRGIY